MYMMIWEYLPVVIDIFDNLSKAKFPQPSIRIIEMSQGTQLSKEALLTYGKPNMLSAFKCPQNWTTYCWSGVVGTQQPWLNSPLISSRFNNDVAFRMLGAAMITFAWAGMVVALALAFGWEWQRTGVLRPQSNMNKSSMLKVVHSRVYIVIEGIRMNSRYVRKSLYTFRCPSS